MLSHVCQQQEIDLLTVALRVVVGIVWRRLEKLGLCHLSSPPQLRAELHDALLTGQGRVRAELLLAVCQGLRQATLGQLTHFVELVVLQQDS